MRGIESTYPMKQLNKPTAAIAALVFALCVLPTSGKTTARFPNDTSLPLPSGKTPAGAFRFAVIGDTGTGKAGQLAIAKRMTQFLVERPFDMVLMLGDNIYSSGKATDISLKFEKPYAELLRQNVRFYASLGNHDVRRGRAFEIGYPNFNMAGRSYYSVIKADGLVELFALDTTNFDDQQRVWLESTLAASKAQWKIAYFHHPLYSSGKTHGSNNPLRAKLEPLFVKYGVAAALSGHDHFYERIKPQRGIQYFVSGAGGQLRPGGIKSRSPLTEVANDKVHSFMFAEASKESLNFWAVDATGKVLDSVSLKPLERKQ